MTRRDKHFPRPGKQPPARPAPNSASSKVDPLLQTALSHHQAGRLAEAEAFYRQVLELSPTHAIALHYLGVIAYQVGNYPIALQLMNNAIAINANYAEAFANRGITLHAMREYQAAVESYDNAIRLKPDFVEALNNRGNSLYFVRRFQDSIESCNRAIALKPDYAEAYNNRGNALQALEQHQAAVESYDRAIALNRNYADAYSNRGNALQSINLGKADPSKRDSTGRDLVFYCGRTTEIWNPEIARTAGIGGSEEAVIWLSRLLHKRGWNVTVYANCGEQPQDYDGVTWNPYWMWNYRDKQNVTILWRYPHLAQYEINSDQIIVDLHDVIPESEFSPDRLEKIDKIFVKSRFHRSLFPDVPDDKFVIASNGIETAAFESACVRDPMLLINTSSADRSLEAFLDCFEEIRKQVPEAKAQWVYGWGVWDAVNAIDPRKMEWKARMQQRMQQLGVAELGRISHSEVARLYHQANIFAYPSEMAEIDCISLSKAMAAGAIPITTDFAALGEKSGHGGVFLHSNKTKDNWTLPGQFTFEMTAPEQKAQFVREAVNLLQNPPTEQQREPMRQWARATFDWNSIAQSWDKALTPPGSDQSALASHDKAIQLNPNNPQAHNNRGSALQSLHQYQAALESYDRAIQLDPAYAEAHANRANALMALKQYEPALESFNRVLELQPDVEYLRSLRLYMRRQICDWENAHQDLSDLESAIERGEKAALPFATLALTNSPTLQRRAAEIYALDKYRATNAIAAPNHPRHDRIRIGYFSADYYNHATSYLMSELFERHDRGKFEVLGFSFGPNISDEMSKRVSASMDRFLDVRSMPDRDIAQLSRELEVDIAIDLKGYTQDHRAGIFNHRAAPIQVSYVGYPGTMGASFMDYLIADPTLIPESSRTHYSEKIIYLPDSYQPNDSRRPVAATAPTRTGERLPESAFVFCCFNNTYKITPAIFDIWMRILARVPGSVLWLLDGDPASTANLRTQAQLRGIDPARLVFARPLPLADHLARHALADLFLDTSPYNAHTTASDALWTGLPVLTCLGETFAGRVAASLVNAVGLPELITSTWPDYEELAVALAQDPQRHQSLRSRLHAARNTAPLFDTPAYTRHLEAAYIAILDRHHAGLPPDHIHVPRLA